MCGLMAWVWIQIEMRHCDSDMSEEGQTSDVRPAGNSHARGQRKRKVDENQEVMMDVNPRNKENRQAPNEAKRGRLSRSCNEVRCAINSANAFFIAPQTLSSAGIVYTIETPAAGSLRYSFYRSDVPDKEDGDIR